MSDLSPEAAALLEAARRTHGPDDSDRERVLSSLHVSLGIAVPVALAASTAQAASGAAGNLSVANAAVQSASTAQTAGLVQTGLTQAATGQGVLASKSALGFGAKLLTWKAGKVFLATVALGSAVGVSSLPRTSKVDSDSVGTRSTQALARGRAHDEDTGPKRAASPVAPPHDVVAAETSPAAVPGVAPQLPSEPTAANQDEASEAAPAVTLASSSEHEVARRPHARPGHVRERARARVQTSQTRLATRAAAATPPVEETTQAPVVAAPAVQAPAETQLIRGALTSLRDRDAVTALALLDEHAARYPSGAFATERRGLHVLALCQAGRTQEGKVEQAAFLAKLGNAPIAARVRAACVEPKK